LTAVDWPDAASRLLKAELARAGLTLAQLAARLQRMGVQETESSVKNKLYRGTFSAVFLMQCLAAMDRDSVDVASLLPRGLRRGPALDVDA
jgi:hypothetical protein